jgi:putative hemolysin
VPPVDSALLEEEIAALPGDSLLVESDQDQVHVAAAGRIPNLLREIGRLREVTFREVGEGTGRAIDLDRFDEHYLHLFVWNRRERALVGAYRLGLTDRLLEQGGVSALYTSTLFKYRRCLFEAMGPAIEMGRSWVRPEYQKSYQGLLLLWKGIGQFAVRHPRYATMFGPVSISADYGSASQRLIVSFLEQNRYVHRWSEWVRPRTPHRGDRRAARRTPRLALGDLDDVSAFIAEIEADQKGVPVLLKQYLKLGGRLLGFNVDPAFGDVLDVLILVDLRLTEPRILARYMGREGAEAFLDHQRRHASRAS